MKKALVIATIAAVFSISTAQSQWVQIRESDGNAVMALAASGPRLIAGTSRGIYSSSNNGLTWTFASQPGPFPMTSLLAGNSWLIAGSSDHVFRSRDDGVSWTSIPSPFVVCLAGRDSAFYAGTFDQGVYRSSSELLTWARIDDRMADLAIFDMAFKDTILFAATEGGLFRSSNNGLNWIESDAGLNTTFVMAIAVKGSNLFAGTGDFTGTEGGDVFRSTDNGTTWIPASSGMSKTSPVQEFAISDTLLFAGTYGSGVYLTEDNGANWTPVSDGLSDTPVHSLLVKGENLFAGMADGTIWMRPLAEIRSATGEESQPGKPEQLPNHTDENDTTTLVASVRYQDSSDGYRLESNFPNPFHSSTAIRFILPRQSVVSLKAFDALGREIATILSGELPAGVHTEQWDAANLPGGVYLLRFIATPVSATRAGTFTQTRPIILVR